MKISDHLRVPYLLASWSVQGADGSWVRHVEYPELDGCAAESEDIAQALDDLEKLRVERVVELLKEGKLSLPSRMPIGESARLGLHESGMLRALESILDLDGSEIERLTASEGDQRPL